MIGIMQDEPEEQKAPIVEQKTDGETEKSWLAPYLINNSWEEELNYKMWVTKGARFVAARRCEQTAKLSHVALTLLSSYLIIIGIAPFFSRTVSATISPDVLALGTTATSILLLAFGLIETARNYPMQAHRFHECAIKISRLYNALRRAKEITDTEEKRLEIAKVTREYEEILEVYENHEPIDLALFYNQKPEYHKIGRGKRAWHLIRYFFKVPLRYYLIMAAPPVLITLIWIFQTPTP